MSFTRDTVVQWKRLFNFNLVALLSLEKAVPESPGTVVHLCPSKQRLLQPEILNALCMDRAVWLTYLFNVIRFKRREFM